MARYIPLVDIQQNFGFDCSTLCGLLLSNGVSPKKIRLRGVESLYITSDEYKLLASLTTPFIAIPQAQTEYVVAEPAIQLCDAVLSIPINQSAHLNLESSSSSQSDQLPSSIEPYSKLSPESYSLPTALGSDSHAYPSDLFVYASTPSFENNPSSSHVNLVPHTSASDCYHRSSRSRSQASSRSKISGSLTPRSKIARSPSSSRVSSRNLSGSSLENRIFTDFSRDIFSDYVNDIRKTGDVLTREEEYDLAQRVSKGDSYARDELITKNLRLVIAIAKKFQRKGHDFSVLVQEGNKGLMRAVEKFDYQLGNKFSTYASWWVKQSILRYFSDNSNIIRRPVHLSESINRVSKATVILRNKLNRDPTLEEIAVETGFPVKKVSQYQFLAADTASLDSDLSEDESMNLYSFIGNCDSSNNPLRDAIKDVLQSLPPREKEVLQLRFGLEDNGCHTLEEVGRRINVSRERVRQIERKSLARLRHPCRASKLVDFYQE